MGAASPDGAAVQLKALALDLGIGRFQSALHENRVSSLSHQSFQLGNAWLNTKAYTLQLPAMTTATRFKPVTLDTPEYAIKMTAQTFREIFGGEPRDIGAETKHLGWHPSWYTLHLPCVRRHWEDKGYGSNVVAVTFYGKRSLYRLQQEGYWLAGKCKVQGKEVSGYTSHIMVEVEGNLFTVVVISIRSDS